MRQRRLSRLLPVFAIAIGVALVAVTSAFKEQPKSRGGLTIYTFAYTGPDYTVANVENAANWTYTSMSPGCSGNQKACSLQATDDYVNTSGSSPVLKSNIDIQAVLTPATNTARVTSIADDNGSFSNQLN